MQTLKNIWKTVGNPDVRIDETLDERFGNEPLFPEKISEATRIMTLVRKKQRETNKN